MENFTYKGKKLNIIKKDDDYGSVLKLLPASWQYTRYSSKAIFMITLMKKINVHIKRTSNPGEDESSPLGVLKSKGNESLPLTGNLKNTIYINESGLYNLILRSGIDKAKDFQRWVTKGGFTINQKNR